MHSEKLNWKGIEMKMFVIKYVVSGTNDLRTSGIFAKTFEEALNYLTKKYGYLEYTEYIF